MFSMPRQRPPIAARLWAISKRADERAQRIGSRFDFDAALYERQQCFANRAFAAANVAAGIKVRIGGDGSYALYGSTALYR